MTDIPMLFSASMVHANLEGRKTNTRRELTSLRGFGKVTEFGLSDTPGYDWHFRDSGMRWHDLHHDELLPLLKAKVGDRIWVKETHAITRTTLDYETGGEQADYEWEERDYGPAKDYLDGDPRGGCCASIYYKADGEDAHPSELYPCIGFKGEVLRKAEIRWRTSIHMPRWASRLTLTVTDVAVERLQEISEVDAIAEGIERHKSGWMPYSTAFYDGDGVTPANYHRDPRESYRQLWNKINGFGAWEANPWVVVYRYTVERRNIDAVAP